MPQAPLRQAFAGSLRSVVGAALAAVFLVAYSGHALAQDDDDDDLTFEQRIITNIMGGFGAAGTGVGIDYHERSPLVIPPSRNLPPPQAEAARPAPNWPTDADRRRRVVKKQQKPLDARETKLWDDPGRPLTPAEMAAGRTARSSSTATTTGPGQSASESEAASNRPLMPDVLGYTGGVFNSIWNKGKPETAPFTGEPPRTSLTEPPTGYMTPSPNQPYGVGMEPYKPAIPKPADLPARTN